MERSVALGEINIIFSGTDCQRMAESEKIQFPSEAASPRRRRSTTENVAPAGRPSEARPRL